MDQIVKEELIGKIINSLREGPKTIIQIADATGIKERHIRNVWPDLKENKYVLTMGWHNRSQLWRINAAVVGIEEFAGKLPYHDLRITGASANLVDIVLSGMIKCGPVPAQNTITQVDYYARSTFPLLAQYLGEANKLHPDEDRLNEIRRELLQAFKVLDSTAYLLKQILGYKDYWTKAGRNELRQAPIIEHASEQIDEAAKLATLYLEGESEITDEIYSPAVQTDE